jgi:acyl-coenzyme A thioesterase PaaI-like protein
VKWNFLAPAMGEILIARGTVKKKGKTFTICTGEAVMVRDNNEHNVAMMVAMMFSVAT